MLGVALVCPVCKRGRLNQVSTSQVILFGGKSILLGDRMLRNTFLQVTCPSKDCELSLDGVVGGLEALGGQLEAAVDNHNHICSQVYSRFFCIVFN